MDAKQHAEADATRLVARLIGEHGLVKGHILVKVIAEIEMLVAESGTGPEGMQAVIKELQNVHDSWSAFLNQN